MMLLANTNFNCFPFSPHLPAHDYVPFSPHLPAHDYVPFSPHLPAQDYIPFSPHLPAQDCIVHLQWPMFLQMQLRYSSGLRHLAFQNVVFSIIMCSTVCGMHLIWNYIHVKFETISRQFGHYAYVSKPSLVNYIWLSNNIAILLDVWFECIYWIVILWTRSDSDHYWRHIKPSPGPGVKSIHWNQLHCLNLCHHSGSY